MDKLDAVQILDSLAQESRLDIFRLLIKYGEDGLCVCEIKEKLGLSHTTLCFHLAKLNNSGLIACKKRGRYTIYNVNYDKFKSTIKYLTDNCRKECKGKCNVKVKYNV